MQRSVRWTLSVLAAAALLAVPVAGVTAATHTSGTSSGNTQAQARADEPDHGARPAIDTRGTHPRIFDLPNGNHVDAYWHRGRRDVPWVVFVHGGFWSYGYAYSRSIRLWGEHELAHGFAAFSIDYRLVPHVQWPTPLEDVGVAVNWIRAHARTFGLDLHKGFIIGHSAGGLLGSITALRTGDFLGAIDLAGSVDPLAEYESAPDMHLRTAALALMGGESPIDNPRRWESARAVNYLGRHKFAFLVMQSVHDKTVPFASSTQFAKALQSQGYPVDLLPMPGTDHELQSATDHLLQDSWMDDVLRGIDK